MNNHPRTTAILAMTADGKIADYQSSPARFGSPNDKRHLEQQVSLADGVIFGADTLRAYGTTISIKDSQLLQSRQKRCLRLASQSQSLQPVQIVVSASGNLNPQGRFFQQPIPRWLITTPSGARLWQAKQQFERILIIDTKNNLATDWISIWAKLQKLGLNKLAILGGGELVASLFAVNLIDELWLTICPLILGGKTSPTPVGGTGWLQSEAKKLQLIEVKQIEQELFLHYRVLKEKFD